MAKYFYDDKDNIKESLLTTQAKSWAESFVDPRKLGKDPKLTSAQLRKYHFEVKTLEERTKNMSNDDFLKLRPIIKMLKSKVAYACRTPGRDRKIPEAFKKYIDEMVDNVNDVNDFKAFALCFESVVGFFYGQGGR